MIPKEHYFKPSTPIWHINMFDGDANLIGERILPVGPIEYDSEYATSFLRQDVPSHFVVQPCCPKTQENSSGKNETV